MLAQYIDNNVDTATDHKIMREREKERERERERRRERE